MLQWWPKRRYTCFGMFGMTCPVVILTLSVCWWVMSARVRHTYILCCHSTPVTQKFCLPDVSAWEQLHLTMLVWFLCTSLLNIISNVRHINSVPYIIFSLVLLIKIFPHSLDFSVITNEWACWPCVQFMITKMCMYLVHGICILMISCCCSQDSRKVSK